MKTGKVWETDREPAKRADKEDLNGIQPYTPFVFSVVAAGIVYCMCISVGKFNELYLSISIGMSFSAWQVTSYLASHFAVQLLDSEIYPVQRLAVVGVSNPD